MTFNQWDIVVVPFPFVDNAKSKPRPVVVLTNEEFNTANGHLVGAMITTASNIKWLGDSEIIDLPSTGLNHTSYIRFKLFTLDFRIGIRKIGELSASDMESFKSNLNKYVLL